MQDPKRLQEIESLGEDEELFQEDETWGDNREESSSWGGIPLMQAVICAMTVLALIFFRVSDDAKYKEIVAWYQHEMVQEIELPAFNTATPKPSQSPEPTVTPAPPISAGAPLQML